jgi:tyrosine-protein kinase Etk/Wzc
VLNQNNPVSLEPSDDIDLANILDVLVEHRWLIASIVTIALICSGLYAFLSPPVYQSDILVQVEDNSAGDAKSVLGDISSLFDVKSTASAEAQILASRLVVSRTVDSLHLDINSSPKRFPIIGDWIARHNGDVSTPGFFGMGGFAWGRESVAISEFDVPVELEGSVFRLKILPAGKYSLTNDLVAAEMIGVVGKQSNFPTLEGTIHLTISAVNAKPSAQFTVVRRSRLATILDLQSNLQVIEKIKDSGVIVASLQGMDPVLVSKVLNEIGSQYVRQNVERKSADAAQSLAFLNEQLPQLRERLEKSEERYTRFRNQHAVTDLTEETKLNLQQAAQAKARLIELQQERAALAGRFNSQHPSIRALDEQIGQLQQFQSGYETQLTRMPDLEQTTARLLLEVTVNTTLYTGLLNNVQQLQLVKAGRVGTVRLVDPAPISEDPVKPKKILIIALALFAGAIIGIVVAFLRDLLFRGVTDPADIENRCGLSVFAAIPLSERQRELTVKLKANSPEAAVLATVAPNEPAVESLRSLRTALQFAMLNSKNNIVLISGPAPGVGKSFISANFAVVLTGAGKKVLLIDGDMRKGYLHRYFGLKRDQGLSEVLAGSATIANVVHHGIAPNLDFISTGALPPNPAELLLNHRTADLLTKLAEHYDFVVLDSPPVLAATDTAVLASFAGTVFLVALAGVTKTGELTEAARRLSQNGVDVNGVLFNGLSPRTGRYAYGSKYGSYRYVAYNYAPEEQ